MIRIRIGTVVEARARHPGLTDCVVEVEGARALAVAYDALTGVPTAGDRVALNTTAVTLGLGTGGAHIVMAIEGRDAGEAEGHAMKLRYSPAQVSVNAVEETHREQIDAVDSLHGMPVVIAGLHSAIAPAAIAARATAADARIVSITTDAASLLLPFSNVIAGLRSAGLVDTTIAAGQAFGADVEAVTLFGALAAAKAVIHADVAIVSMGPGSLGTGSRWGFAAIEVGSIVNTVAAMGGWPVVVPRLSFADPRSRHRGVSHHTLTALAVAALARATVAMPAMTPEREALVREQLEASGIAWRHDVVGADVTHLDEALRSSPVPLSSMGRVFDDDPDCFRAAAAAGALAAESVVSPER